VSENAPPVSIFITTFLSTEKRGRILKDICENALAQNYPDFEVVVSDNAGEYPAEKALESIDDPRLKVFRNAENVGQTGNMNKCLEYCSHDIIKQHCDDDLLHPDFLKYTVPQVDDETFVVVSHEEYIIGKTPESLSQPVQEPTVVVREPGFASDFWKFDYYSLPCCTLFTKKLFQDLGCCSSDSRLPDWDLLMAARLRKKVAHVQQTLAYMGVWDESFTQQMLREKPYFFTINSLITRFRLLHDPIMQPAARRSIRAFLIKEFLRESLRLPRNFYRKVYWQGYGEYLRKLSHLISRNGKNFEYGDQC